MKKYGFTILNVKVLFLILGALVLATPANAKRKKMPKIDLKTDMIHDSICREGFLLYCYEKVAWVGTDMFFAHAKDKQNEIAGVFTRRVDDKFFNVFYDKNGNCIFEYIVDENGMGMYSDSLRCLSEDEKLHVDRVKVMLQKCNELKIVKNYGSINVDIIPLENGLTRVYFMTGTSQNNVLPLGNDYSFDFDADLNLVAHRKYHESFLQFKLENKDEVETVMHSHLEDNPYITPTDVCNFHLYGKDLFGLNLFSVYSVGLKRTFIYSTKERRVMATVVK